MLSISRFPASILISLQFLSECNYSFWGIVFILIFYVEINMSYHVWAVFICTQSLDSIYAYLCVSVGLFAYAFFYANVYVIRILKNYAMKIIVRTLF